MVNYVIKNTITGEEFRILYVFENQTILINLEKDSCKTILFDLDELNKNIKEGSFEVINDNYMKIVDEGSLTKKEKNIRDRAYEIIEYINQEPNIYIKDKRRGLIIDASSKFKISERTIYKYLIRFWKGGKCKNALIPRYENCGGKGKERRTSKVKRGRKRKYNLNNNVGCNVDEDIKRIFKIALEKYYYNKRKNSLITTYELMIKEYFSDDKNNLIKNYPTFGQFKYWFYKYRNLKYEISQRFSSKKYYLNKRPLLNTSTNETFGPGSLFQIDATVADVYLVSRFNKEWIIGRPIVYFVTDVFSRMITGMYVGLEGPSWIGAMMAIVNAATDKVKYCEEYGIKINEEEWVCKHLPDSIIADRGEFEGNVAEGLINGLHIKIQNTPSFRADWKGIVEQFFRTVNIKVKPFIDGFIDKDFRERGGKDYRLDAKLDLYHFTKILIKCVLYHNNYHVLKNYDKTELMIKDNVECIPKLLWDWGIKNCSGMLRSVSENVVKLNVLPEDYAFVTAKGIKFKGIYYTCDIAIRERWFEIARNKGGWKVRIKYDPRTVNYIYIVDENNRDYYKCNLLEYQEKFIDKTLDEINQLYYIENLRQREKENINMKNKLNLYDEIEEIIKECNTNGEVFIDKSERERIKNIRENRKNEKELNRLLERFELEEKIDIDKANSNSKNNDEDIDYYFIFKSKQEEFLNGK